MSDTITIDHNVYPGMQYDDALAAIDWLEKAFGFRRHLVIPGEGDRAVAHAQVRTGEHGGSILLGSTRKDPSAYLSPRKAGGVTHGIYVRVRDIDEHYARAKAAGAEIVLELHGTPYGSRDYTARDPEGFIWNFGTYDPDA